MWCSHYPRKWVLHASLLHIWRKWDPKGKWPAQRQTVNNWLTGTWTCLSDARNTHSHLPYCVYVCAPLCPTLCNPMDCSPPGSSTHGFSQAWILEWVAISYSRESSWPKDWTHISCVSWIGRWVLYLSATWEAHCSKKTKKQRNKINYLLSVSLVSTLLWNNSKSVSTLGQNGTEVEKYGRATWRWQA